MPKKTEVSKNMKTPDGSWSEAGGMIRNLTAQAIKNGTDKVVKTIEGTKNGDQLKRSFLDGFEKSKDVVSRGTKVAAATAQELKENVSGVATQRAVQDFVDQQRRYNDVLATRLAEALDRIEVLESKLASISK